MKINEITIPRQLRKGIAAAHQSEDIDSSLRTQLRKDGWYFIDSGLFSQVYVNDNKSYVLKINTHPDQAFDKFVKFTKKMKSPYLPKILDRKYFTKNGKVYYLYLIEKLVPCPKEIADTIFSASVQMRLGRGLDDVGREFFSETYPGLYDFLKTVINAASILGPDGHVDVGPRNIMMRPSDKMPVIMDPWAVIKDRYR